MKANEAPYKIFLATTKDVQNLDHSFVGIAHSDPQDIVEPIEYIRKDAFVKKACEFVKSHIDHYIGHYLNDDDTYLDDSFIEDFKKYMEK